ncbi:Fatty acid synthase [Trichinella pseudospiralis]
MLTNSHAALRDHFCPCSHLFQSRKRLTDAWLVAGWMLLLSGQRTIFFIYDGLDMRVYSFCSLTLFMAAALLEMIKCLMQLALKTDGYCLQQLSELMCLYSLLLVEYTIVKVSFGGSKIFAAGGSVPDKAFLV